LEAPVGRRLMQIPVFIDENLRKPFLPTNLLYYFTGLPILRVDINNPDEACEPFSYSSYFASPPP